MRVLLYGAVSYLCGEKKKKGKLFSLNIPHPHTFSCSLLFVLSSPLLGESTLSVFFPECSSRRALRLRWSRSRGARAQQEQQQLLFFRRPRPMHLAAKCPLVVSFTWPSPSRPSQRPLLALPPAAAAASASSHPLLEEATPPCSTASAPSETSLRS